MIVGVNRYRLENEDEIEILDIHNTAVRAAQIKRIAETKRRRQSNVVEKALATITDVAKTGEGNLLGAAVDAARATVGEISDAMRAAFGDHFGKPSLTAFVMPPSASTSSISASIPTIRRSVRP